MIGQGPPSLWPTDSNPPQLRIFTGQEPARPPPQARVKNDLGLSPRTTFWEFFEQYFCPKVLQHNAQRGQSQYAETALLFCEAVGDLPLEEIGEAACGAFCQWYLARPGRRGTVATNSLRKQVRHLKRILAAAGPRVRGLRGQIVGLDKRGLFGLDADGDPRWPPECAMPPAEFRDPTPFTLDEIGLWMDSCARATRPLMGPLRPADWWRSLVLFSYNTGVRIGATLTITWPMLQGDWLIVPPELMKGRRRQGKFWINRPARAAMEHIRTPAERIFCYPFGISNFQTRARQLLRSSAIDAERQFGGCHRLRGALLTYLVGRNPAIAKLQAGHSYHGDVLLQHYADPRAVAELMETVPQPRPQQPYPPPNDPQLRLF